MAPLPGSALFEARRAEYEGAWVDRLFVEPSGFARLLEGRSVIVFGAAGSGKTIVQQQLLRRAEATGHLVVSWSPALLETTRGSEAIHAFMRQIMQEWALALMHYIGQNPTQFRDAPTWVRDTLVWIIRARLPGRWTFHLSQVAEDSTPEGYALLRELGAVEAELGLSTDCVDGHLARKLAAIMPEIGISGTWIVTDGTEPWLFLEKDRLNAVLDDIITPLTYLEAPGVTWRLFLPEALATPPSRLPLPARQRVELYTLHWSSEQLRSIVERRLSLVFDRDDMKIEHLAETSPLREYVQHCGGSTPRGWLAVLEPFVAACQRVHGRPLSPEEWERTRQEALPKLFVEPQTGAVLVGHRQIAGLSPSLRRVLYYLYNHPEQRCTRSELYFVAYREMESEYNSALIAGDWESLWEHPDDWGPVIDTVLWRLRKVLEWDSRRPHYIFSERGDVRGQGNVWLDNIL